MTANIAKIISIIGTAFIYFIFTIYFSKKTISRVDSISAMAPGFIDWIMDYAKRKKNSSDRVFRLTSPNTQLPQSSISEAHKVWLEKGLNDKIPTIFFVGTHIFFPPFILCPPIVISYFSMNLFIELDLLILVSSSNDSIYP